MKRSRAGEWKSHLNLLFVLSRMHMRANDYRTFLGALWSLAGPLLTFSVLYFIFIDRFGRDISLFSLKLLAGVLAVNFFNSVVHIIMGAVRQSREVGVDCLVPSEVFVAAPLSVPLTKFCVEMGLCVLVAFSMGALKFANLPWILLTGFFFCLMAAGLAMMLGVLNFLAADVGEIWNRIEHIFLFVTPVFYTLPSLSPWAGNIVLWFNPMTPFVITFQTLISNDAVPGFSQGLVICGIFYALAFFVSGYALLKKFENQILEVA